MTAMSLLRHTVGSLYNFFPVKNDLEEINKKSAGKADQTLSGWLFPADYYLYQGFGSGEEAKKHASGHC